jgi:hypothetical protein
MFRGRFQAERIRIMAAVHSIYNEFGLLTPETTLERATALNNALQCLWRKATEAQKTELDPVISGFVDYFDHLRNSFWARLTEYGEIQGWEEKYQALLNKFSLEQGKSLECPVIVPGETPFVIPESVSVEATRAIKEAEATGDRLTADLKRATRNMIILSMGTAIVAGGIVWWITRKR